MPVMMRVMPAPSKVWPTHWACCLSKLRSQDHWMRSLACTYTMRDHITSPQILRPLPLSFPPSVSLSIGPSLGQGSPLSPRICVSSCLASECCEYTYGHTHTHTYERGMRVHTHTFRAPKITIQVLSNLLLNYYPAISSRDCLVSVHTDD